MAIQINNRKFIGSFNLLRDLPQSNLSEFCFIGRSNVGKSSLINYICNKKDLAKVSSTPGKTQSFNFFLINDLWHLVDLPGYGYAKRSKTLRESWEVEMYKYFSEREQLITVFLLIDSRVRPQKSDLQLIEWFGEHRIPFVIIFTKADKRELKYCKLNIKEFLDVLSEDWNELPPYFVTSSEEKNGGDAVLEYIEDLTSRTK